MRRLLADHRAIGRSAGQVTAALVALVLICSLTSEFGASEAGAAGTERAPRVTCSAILDLPGPGYRLVGLSSDPCDILETDAHGNVIETEGQQANESPPPQPLHAPISGIAGLRNAFGYWLVGADGGVFALGQAGFFGSGTSLRLNAPVVGIAATPDDEGYYLVAADGGVFCYGDARFQGSMAGHPLNAPIVGIAVDPASGGYRLVAGDGGVFAFGVPFLGSEAGMRLNGPIVGIATDPANGGYWLAASDGGVFAFDAPFYGSATGTPGGYAMGTIVGISGSDDSYVLGNQAGFWAVCAAPGVETPTSPGGCLPV